MLPLMSAGVTAVCAAVWDWMPLWFVGPDTVAATAVTGADARRSRAAADNRPACGARRRKLGRVGKSTCTPWESDAARRRRAGVVMGKSAMPDRPWERVHDL